MKLIPVFKPLITSTEINAAKKSLKVGWLGMGKSVNYFEKKIKQITNSKKKYVVAVNTGHSALHLSMMLLGIKKGDEVITPSFNNIADIQSILAVGAKPIFCDILEDTLCIDPSKIKQLISKKTKAIIAMDYGASIAEHDEINFIAKKNRLRVIHDAAHSLGSEYKNKKIGSFSDVIMFSFDPVKTFTCIDGGAIIVNTHKEMLKLHEMRLLGMTQKTGLMYKNKRAWTYDITRLGFRYHLANLHAAIGIEQLKKLNVIKKTRRDVFLKYNQSFKFIKGIIIPKINKDSIPFHYCIRVKFGQRIKLVNFLKKKGIDSGIHWRPNHWLSFFKKEKSGNLEVTNRIGKEILSLPFHSLMNKKDVDRVIYGLKSFSNE